MDDQQTLGPGLRQCNDDGGAVSGSDPRVAVIIAAKDAARTIARAVRSALAQSEAAEVIVVDDGSSDNTAAVAETCDDGTGRLRVMRQPNRGPSAARNTAIQASISPYLCILDADDFFMPGRLRQIFNAVGTDWDLASDKLLLGKEGAEDGPYERWRASEVLPPQLSLAQFVDGNITRAAHPRTELGYMQTVMRRAFLDAHALRFRENLWLAEDYVLYAEMLARGGRFRTVESYGYVAIQRPDSLSHQHPPERLEALVKADEALARIPGISADGLRALARHRDRVRLEWIHRRVLEAKQAGRLGQAMSLALSGPGVFAYILSETTRAWRARAA